MDEDRRWFIIIFSSVSLTLKISAEGSQFDLLSTVLCSHFINFQETLMCESFDWRRQRLRVMLHYFYGAESAAHVTLTSIHHNEATIRSPSTQLRVQLISSDLFLCPCISTFNFIYLSSYFVSRLFLFVSPHYVLLYGLLYF